VARDLPLPRFASLARYNQFLLAAKFCGEQVMRTLSAASLALGLAVATPLAARADVIFDISGTATAEDNQSCGSDCLFSGTLTVDVTTGAATAVDVTFPGLSDITSLDAVLNEGHGLEKIIAGPNSLKLFLEFQDTPPAMTLAGFTGGTITGDDVESESSFVTFFDTFSGTITAAPTTAVPEPSSWALLATALVALIAFTRRKVLVV
jgi:hypothetical protein